MFSMRIVVIMKSRFSFERLKRDLSKYTVHDHIEGIGEIQECVQYWNPNIAIIDSHSPFYESAKELFFRFNIDVVEFGSDFGSVIQEVDTYSAFYDSEESIPISVTHKPQIPDYSEYEKKAKEEVKREKEVIVEVRKEIVEKEVEIISYTNVPAKVIVVASMWGGAGSTYLGTNLARAVANRGVSVSYVEYPTITPYVFDYLNVSSKEEEEGFTYIDIARVIKQKGSIPRGRGWAYQGIQWVLNDSRFPPIKDWPFEKMLRLIYSLNTPIIVIDISTAWNEEETKGILHQADCIFVCVEPDAVKIDRLVGYNQRNTNVQRPEHEFLNYLKQVEKDENIPFEYVVTKMNEGVDRKIWLQHLDKKPKAEFDYIPYPDFINCLWQSEFLYETEFQEEIDQSLMPIIKEILPNKFHYLEDKPRKGLSILNPFKKLLERK